ncbi:MAG: BatA and WFA domain-containing protein [Rubripirellula sp.]
MSWISALSPWQWGLFAAVPVGIVLLYFLKLRREPVEVPSTYLWSRTIEDLHVNSLMQRLRRSLLLFLQLLAVALAAIALFRPGIRGESSSQGRMVFLLDTSASMQSRDGGEGGVSRFEAAREQIRGRIESMSDSETAMLVTFSDRPDTVQSFTTDRRRLREALSRVKVTNHPTDILGALKAADGLANPRRSSEVGNINDLQVADAMPADLLIFTDGGFQPVTEFNLGNLIPTYISIGDSNHNNLAITAFSAERNIEQPSQVQAFATVINLGDEPIETTATLTAVSSANDVEFLDAVSVSLAPEEQTGLSFTIENDEGVALQLSLDIDDDLPVDNVAFAGLSPMRNVNVLVVTSGNSPLELGLETEKAAKICATEFVLPSYLETEAWKTRAETGTDDLVIFDRCSPATMPATNTFFIGSLPPADADESTQDWQWGSEPAPVALVDIDRTHPMMRFLELFSLLIFEGRSVTGPAGSTELVAADSGPMLVLSPRDGYQDLVLGFEVISTDADGLTETNTNWYAERSWPVFVLNVLRYLAGAAEATGSPSFRPGETVRIRLENAVAQPKLRRVGETETTDLVAGPSGLIEIVGAEMPGNYRVEDGERLADSFSVNLFDRSESDLKVASSVELGYEAVEAATGGVEQRREYWRLALMCVLGVLAAEWWVFSRRVA